MKQINKFALFTMFVLFKLMRSLLSRDARDIYHPKITGFGIKTLFKIIPEISLQ